MPDIEKLVLLIENTKDDATKSILRRLLATEVEKKGMLKWGNVGDCGVWTCGRSWKT